MIVDHRTKKNCRVVKMPTLDREMVLRNATNERLAEAAGVCDRTISKARNGGSLRREFAEWITAALFGRTFTRSNQGCHKSV